MLEQNSLWFNPLFTHFKKFILHTRWISSDQDILSRNFQGREWTSSWHHMYLLTYVCLLVGVPKRDLSRLAISSNGFKSLFKNDSLLVLSDVASSTLTLVVLSSQKLWHYLIEIYDYGVTAVTRKVHTLTK